MSSLEKMPEKWMWKEISTFRAVAPSDLKHDSAVPQYPEGMDQLVRLEVLNIIAMMRYPHAQSAVCKILKQKMWGVTGTAAALLLTECGEEALDLVKSLLSTPDHKVRMQAALILSLWGREPEAIATLQQGYEKGDRQMKEKILEGIGRLGADSSIPFLVGRLNESSQSLRIIAASALLEALYH
jgi:HEAT repeat protein